MAKSKYAHKIQKRHKIPQKNMTAVVTTTQMMMMTAITKLTMDNLTMTPMTMTTTTTLTATINYQVKACRRQLITLPAAHLDVEQGGVEEGGDVLEEVKNG